MIVVSTNVIVYLRIRDVRTAQAERVFKEDAEQLL